MSSSSPRLHHVGIVVPSAARAAEMMAFLGLAEAYRGFVDAYEATCIFAAGNGGSAVEFVVPQGGTLAKFNRGVGGLHHIAIAVNSIREVAEELAQDGISLLESEPIRDAGNFLCNFLPPSHTRGVIVEYIEELS